MDTSYPTDPVRIYVLWHPDSTDAQTLAEAVFQWFRGRPDDLTEAGYGIPVHYRTADLATPGASLMPIFPDAADVTIVVPLVDEHMVTDPVWRGYLEALTATPVQIYPVVLHPSAYNLPEPLAALNFIRLDRSSDPDYWQRSERLTARRERLLSLLTQACCRLLTPHPTGSAMLALTSQKDEAGLPVKVFLSHAKADGTAIATALRDGLLHHGQLQAFFDESDLPLGYGYSKRLVNAAGAATDKTTAMIAVYTDAYAGRPWCQRELRLARRPVLLDGEGGYCWGNKPVLVIDALEERRTRFLGEIGEAPVIRWDPARTGEIIDLLLREILWTLYYQRWSHRLKLEEDTHAFCGALDLHVAMQIQRQTNGTVRRILVPPPGPAITDRDWLTGLLPGIEVGTFDELEKSRI